MDHLSVILKKIRIDKKLTLRSAAQIIGRSTGWLSEVENGKKRAFINERELKRIITCYQAKNDLKRYQLWAATQRKTQKNRVWFERAIYKHLRIKRELSLTEASKKLEISKSHLCNIEASRKVITLEFRERILAVYNYKCSTFYNFTNIESRACGIPIEFRLKTLLQNLEKDKLEDVFAFARKFHT